MYEAVIKNLQRHIEPTGEETAIFSSLAVIKTVKRKEFLLKEGDIARQQFFVIDGCLRTYTTDPVGKEHVLMFAPEDWWCSGDLYSFLSGQKSVNNLEALEPHLYYRSARTIWTFCTGKRQNLNGFSGYYFKMPLSFIKQG